MPYPLCRHIKTNGLQCEAPSLTGESFCYFHTRLHQRHAAFRHTDRTRGYLVPGQHIELAPIEDRDSVQLALSLVINALAAGQLETAEPPPSSTVSSSPPPTPALAGLIRSRPNSSAGRSPHRKASISPSPVPHSTFLLTGSQTQTQTQTRTSKGMTASRKR